MTRQKTIHTPEDIRGVIYIIDYLMKNHYPMSSGLSNTDFQDIERIINKEHSQNIKESTIRRICTFRRKPTRLSYAKLDIFTQWCFDDNGDYDNFRLFLKECHDMIINSDVVSDKEVTSILKTISNTKVVVSRPVNIDLGTVPLSLNLGEGFVEKLIQEVSIVTGNLLNKTNKQTSKELTVYNDRKVNIRLMLKENRRQNNIDNIILKAIEFARQKEASNNPVNPDWIIEFFNLSQDCSNESMQYLWAKLLASEIDQPSSISRRTLSIIKLLEPKEAQIFTKLCNCIWNLLDMTEFKEKVLIKDMYMEEQYSDEVWDFDSMYIPHLEAIGLVVESFIDMSPDRIYKLDFFGKNHEIQSSKKLAQLEITTLTKAGKEVFAIISPTPNEDYYEHTLNYFKSVDILKK